MFFIKTRTIFQLIQDTCFIRKKILTKFHEDGTINVAFRVKNAPPPCGHFHEDRTINMGSRVLTTKNAPPPGGNVFQPIGTIFEPLEDIISTNVQRKFHENKIINVASRMLTRQLLTTHNARGTKGDPTSTMCQGDRKISH
ncbi:hypothetical protein DPMN_096426 [Dreissena polymorpha]|uniref:Uncharacterized protein n=1 Tax=Dreissena polymorpha TaxID=45954 RepID=A0A9D4R3N0_DREPO|nr:hypothetical protein DPMN_096426 [Dreissena polymorpha]